MFLRHSEDAELLSCLTLSDPMDVDHQAPLSMGFSMQEYQHGLLCPSPGDIPNPGIKPGSSALQADTLPSKLTLLLTFCHLACFLFPITYIFQRLVPM